MGNSCFSSKIVRAYFSICGPIQCVTIYNGKFKMVKVHETIYNILH